VRRFIAALSKAAKRRFIAALQSHREAIMSEHAWVQENLATYVAGGMPAEERELLEEHVAECSPCAGALEQLRSVDRRLETLFASVRPNPALEDRSIQLLRQAPAVGRAPISFTRKGKFFLGVAAAVLLAALGAGLNALDEANGFAFPGAQRGGSANSLKSVVGLVLHNASTKSVTEETVPSGFVWGLTPAAGLTPDLAFSPDGRRMAAGIMDGSVNMPSGGGQGKVKDEPGQDLGGKNAPATELDGDRKVTKDLDQPPRAPPPTMAPRATPPAIAFPPAPAVSGTPVSPNAPVFNFFSGTEGGSRPMPRQPEYFKPGDAFPGQSASGSKADPSRGFVAGLGQVPDKKGDKGEGKTEGPKDGEKVPAPQFPPPPPKEEATPSEKTPPPTGRKVIRSGDIEFEVDSFDDALAVITRLIAATKDGFIATVNSDKLPNGKVRGAVVVRMPPGKLDGFILDLRKELTKTGELKGLRIGSEDVSRQYTDLESRLRAARTMEERLLKIIKEGKGQIKDLLQAETELGKWRTVIEQQEGELRYLANLVSLSTLTVKLTEKEIRQAAYITENERVQAGVEVEEVEKAFRKALDAIAAVKGRVTRSELKQLAAGQYSALLHFEVAPDDAGPLRDLLAQLGTVARLEIDRVQRAHEGVLGLRDGQTKRGPTQFLVALYNLANVMPRETVTLRIAAQDVPAAYAKLREILAKAKGRITCAQLNEQDQQNVSARLDFDIRRADEGALQAALAASGDLLSRQVIRQPAGENFTDAKVLFNVLLINANNIPPRETVTLRVAAADVAAAYRKLRDMVAGAKGRVTVAKLNEQDAQNVTAQLDFDIRRTDEGALQAALADAGEVLSRQVARQPASENVTDAKVQFNVELTSASSIPPRETTTIGVEVSDVDAALAVITAQVREAGGRTIPIQVVQDQSGRQTATIQCDVPLAAAPGLVAKIKSSGHRPRVQVTRNAQAPDGKLARARLQVTLSNAELLVPGDEGLWAQVRRGLAFSLRGLSLSASWLVVGVLFVLPWVLFVLLLFWLARRLWRGSPRMASAAPAAGTTAGG
jgi:hypothetical protein